MKRRAVQTQRVGFGPLVGLRDSLDPSVSNDPKYARVIQNLRPVELTGPTTFVGRPGFEQHNPTQLGVSFGGFTWSAYTGQLVHHFVREDGEERTFVVVGGHLYYHDWSAAAYNEVTAGGVTWDQTAKYYGVTYGDKMVYHDGTNTPRTKDPVDLSGAALTNAPIFYGQPVVYYAKLFAIKAAERSVIVWSEENDPTIGYETTPYSNSWQIGQTDQEPLYALCATNEALYYFRARSIGTIRGAVTPEFTTDGTHEGISQTDGTVSPDGVCLARDKVYFINADAEPCVIVGGTVKNLADDVRETVRGLDKTKLDKAITRHDPASGLVLFGVVEIGQEQPSCIIAINPLLDVPVAVWRGFVFSALGIANNASGEPTILHLSTDGYAYAHGQPDGDVTDDEHNAGTVAIAHVIESCHLATDTEYEKRFSRADMVLRAEGAISGIQTYRVTPYGPSTILEGSVSDPREPEWDSFNWDEAPWAEDAAEAKLALGLNALGRWVRHGIVHQETGESFGFSRMTTEFTPAGDMAGAR